MTDKKYSYNGWEAAALIIWTVGIITLSVFTGQVTAPTEGPENMTKFEEVMNREAHTTYQHALDSFEEGDNQTAFKHIESGNTMIWTLIQTTDNQEYRQIWGDLNFQCLANEQVENCKKILEAVMPHLYELSDKGQENRTETNSTRSSNNI